MSEDGRTTDELTYPVLAQLEEDKIFQIFRYADAFIIEECCDHYFERVITANDLRQLGQEIIDLANS